jgi:DNA-binding SARP family transcriptional activator
MAWIMGVVLVMVSYLAGCSAYCIAHMVADGGGPIGKEDPVACVAAAGRGVPVVLVLGAVEVAGRDVADIESGKRNLLPELAAYLRLNPGRTAEEVSRAMGGPRGPWAAATRASSMSRLRAWLGRDRAGRNYVRALGEGRLYTLLGSVRCDWDDFQLLARRGLAATPAGTGVADLRAALDLVRGQPFAGAGPHSYIWAEFARQEMISAIVDVAHALAERLTEAGDPARARAAAARGLEVEPGSELLFRDLFRAEHRAGNAAGIEEAAERLMVTLAELDLDMEPPTADLLSELRGQRRIATQSRPWQVS